MRVELVDVWGGWYCLSLFRIDYGCVCNLLARMRAGLQSKAT